VRRSRQPAPIDGDTVRRETDRKDFNGLVSDWYQNFEVVGINLITSDNRFAEIYHEHADTVYRLCFLYLRGNVMDAEDATQTAFCGLLRKLRAGDSLRSPKAWLITCAANSCKDILGRGHRRDIPLEDVYTQTDARDETLELILRLPKYEKLSVYLHYYEGYTAKEIGKMLGKRDTSVWGYLSKGRAKLKQLLTEDI